MVLCAKGRAKFSNGSVLPSAAALCSVALKDGVNTLRFEHRPWTSPELVRYASARLFCWDVNDRVVVTDMDGTITPSDLEGHIRTMRLGQYDFMHSGKTALRTAAIACLGNRVVTTTVSTFHTAVVVQGMVTIRVYLLVGVCQFFGTLADIGCKVLYLTARPISWVVRTVLLSYEWTPLCERLTHSKRLPSHANLIVLLEV